MTLTKRVQRRKLPKFVSRIRQKRERQSATLHRVVPTLIAIVVRLRMSLSLKMTNSQWARLNLISSTESRQKGINRARESNVESTITHDEIADFFHFPALSEQHIQFISERSRIREERSQSVRAVARLLLHYQLSRRRAVDLW